MFHRATILIIWQTLILVQTIGLLLSVCGDLDILERQIITVF